MPWNFTSNYLLARAVFRDQDYESDWNKFLKNKCHVKSLLGDSGFRSSHASSLDKIREKIEKDAGTGSTGDVIYAAAENNKSKGSVNDRAAALKMLKHVYRVSKIGAKDVWVYAPPKHYTDWVFLEIIGSASTVKAKLSMDVEIFSDAEKKWMADALAQSLRIAEDMKVRLAGGFYRKKAVVKRWFLDEGCGDEKVDEAIKKLLEGFKKIAVACGSNCLVFTDFADWRWRRDRLYGAAYRGGEIGGFPVIYLEGAFAKLTGNTGKIWLCAQTIIHELSHVVVSTEDHRYGVHGLKPKAAGFPYAKAINNADSWGYFALDFSGYLSNADRTNVLGRNWDAR